MMTRRTALSAGIAAAATAASAGVLALPALRPEHTIARFVRQQVPDLVMDEKELLDFAAEFIDHLSLSQRRWVAVAHLTLLERRQAHHLAPDWLLIKQGRGESKIITDFMRSTDYFDPLRNGAPVRFVVFADPYAVGCSNPLPGYAEV